MKIKDMVARAIQKILRISGLPDMLRSSNHTICNEIKSSRDRGNETQSGIRADAQAAGRYIDKGTQILLGMKYNEAAEKGIKIAFADVEFRNHSQTGEDGILWYLFSLIGTTNKMVVEMCAGVGYECNGANLIINHGWQGLLFDGNPENIKAGEVFFSKHPDTCILPPSMIKAWITAENVNRLIVDTGADGEIDLFSLDVDGIDYWIWKALEVISPRVVVVEFNGAWGSDRAVTVPYASDFVAQWQVIHEEKRAYAQYGGASLAAFVSLAREKGYRLVGANSLGYNAFFVRNDIAPDLLPEVDAALCLTHPVCNYANAEARKVFENRADLPWLDV